MKSIPEFWFEPQPWLNGQSSPANSFVEVRNPATGEMLAKVGLGDTKMLCDAIEGAVKVQEEWAESSSVERGVILKKAADLLLDRKDEFARLLTAEQGKPYAQALGEVHYAASFFQWFGEEARRVYGRIAAHPDQGREYLIESRPVGVVGLITPWNFPLAQGAKKIAAALAAGCCAVWKPSEFTPLIALALGPLMAEAGLPMGVLQIVPGYGGELGAALVDHPEVKVISLTGATETGRSVMAAAAGGIKRVSLELGGNAPFIVLPDADLDQVVEDLIQLKLLTSGQVCVTANRVFVHADSEIVMREKLAEKLADAKIGNGLEDGVDAGPLIHQQACDKVLGLLDAAVASGAEIVYQNRTYQADQSLVKGSFFPPTLLARVSDEMALAREEVFGPIISLISYSSTTEVIRRANETPYGLAAYVYGSDLTECRAVASRLEVGIIGVNEWRPLKAEIPFGGIKQSGIGVEGGEEGIHEFCDTRVISLPKPKLV
ncbi:MAG: aldehyde dehydrogenase family protein [Verrucomicrobiales bacterium]|nr:aldehyde dehydrogenase family protein [Verrucomicrobiales bacterium]